MSVIVNAKGTSVPYFKIGKSGTTLYQGSTNPSSSYNVVAGDLFIDTLEKSLKFWDGTEWIYTTFGDTTLNSAGIESSSDLYLNAATGKNVIIDGIFWPNTDGTSGQILRTNGSGALYWSSTTSGTVTSVAASGGTTGLSFSGSPITESGTLTLTGVLSPPNGGTGLSSLGTSNQLLGINSAANALEYKTVAAGTGINVSFSSGQITIASTGVTSVAFTESSTQPIFNVAGSPITTTGTIDISLKSQSSGLALMSPTGSSGQPVFRAIEYSDLPIKLYRDNASTPQASVVTGTNSSAMGSGASATLNGQKAYANGYFSFAGDAQNSVYILRNQTTNATPTELFLDGASAQIELPAFSVFTFDVLVSARRTDASGEGAAYRFVGAALKNATDASITFIGTPSKTVIAETSAAWDADVATDTTTGAIKIVVTGETAKTIRWVATVQTTEVAN